MTMTQADYYAARGTVDDTVDRVRRRLAAAGAVGTIARLDRLSAAERLTLTRLECQATASLTPLPGRAKDGRYDPSEWRALAKGA